MAKIEDVLDQEKGVNSDLKKQYDELAETKADLESKLRTALQEKSVAVAALQSQNQAQAQILPSVATATAQSTSPSTATGH